MGWFCDHEWDWYNPRHTLFGNPIPRHKCAKCGKVEDCNKDGTRRDGDGGWNNACTKCGY